MTTLEGETKIALPPTTAGKLEEAARTLGVDPEKLGFALIEEGLKAVELYYRSDGNLVGGFVKKLYDLVNGVCPEYDVEEDNPPANIIRFPARCSKNSHLCLVPTE